MKIETTTIEVDTRGVCDMHDITGDVAAVIHRFSLFSGTVTVFVPGATAGVTTIELEPGLMEDMPEMFEKIAPRDAEYHHDRTWHDGNGFSHVRASLLGPSLTIPFTRGEMTLGTWQQIVLVDFDNRPRRRKVVVQVMGQ